jgi:hypothetical protein
VQLIEAVGNCSADGPPTIAFSHTANGDRGYNYAAIVSEPDQVPRRLF